MRTIGLDFGSKTVGVAMGDPFGWTAQALEVIRRPNESDVNSTLTRLEEIIKEYSVDKIVIGFPKNMNNTEGERCEKTIKFIKKLDERFHLPVVKWDERLSTMFAKRTLIEADVRREDRKKVIDKVAAVIILQGYLDTYQ